jgi:hypothetical protein
VTDGLTDATETIQIVMNEVNSAPVLATAGDKTAYPNRRLGFGISGSDSDLPTQTLRFSLVSAPAGATIDPVTGLFDWTPATDLAGSSQTVTVRVVDNGSSPLSAQQSLAVRVSALPSLVLTVPPDQTIDELATFEVTNSVSDPESLGRVMTFALVEAPSGMALDATTGRLT